MSKTKGGANQSTRTDPLGDQCRVSSLRHCVLRIINVQLSKVEQDTDENDANQHTLMHQSGQQRVQLQHNKFGVGKT